jgi:hypothetical protein
MMKANRSFRCGLLAAGGALWGLVALALLAASAARSETLYTLQPIVKLGDTVAGITLRAAGPLQVASLNDNGQLAFVARNEAGGEVLFQYGAGQFHPIVVGGGLAPGGSWPADVRLYNSASMNQPVSMNQRGNIAFAAPITIQGETSVGIFRWDAETRQVTPVALKGLPASDNLTFAAGAHAFPAINNHDEIAFAARAPDAAGKIKEGLFLLGRDQRFTTIAAPGQKLSNGRTMERVYPHALNDGGVITFTGAGTEPGTAGAYVWEQGTLTQVLGWGSSTTRAAGAPPYLGWSGLWPNNADRSVLSWVTIQDGGQYNYGLLRLVNRRLEPVLVPGQVLPDGGKLRSADWVSEPNEAGQHALIARLQNGPDTVYLLSPDGTLTPVLQKGTTTEVGTITKIRRGIEQPAQTSGLGLNRKGQIALVVQIDSGPDTIVLLTPAQPQP